MEKLWLVAVFAIVASGLLVFALSLRSKSHSGIEPESFRDLALAIMRKTRPTTQFETVDGDPSTIRAGAVLLGLDNLRRNYERSERDENELENLIKVHLDNFVSLDVTPEGIPQNLAEARSRILPQLIRKDFHVIENIVTLPFGGDLAIALVYDSPASFAYLLPSTIDQWKSTTEEVLQIALQNLQLKSQGMQMEQFEKQGLRFISIVLEDGFDAARILLPGLRSQLSQRMGTPFYFGVPNRDFLIVWSHTQDEERQNFPLARLRSDYEEMPYPLSPMRFVVESDGALREANP